MHKDCIILCDQTNSEGELLCLQLVNGKPFIEYVAQYLRRFHICKVIFAVNAQKETFKKYVLDHREAFSFAFDFAEQEKYNGSGQAILNALQYSDTPDVLIMNGHCFFDVNIDDFIAWQQTKMGDVTMALVHREQSENYLLSHLDDKNFISTFDKGAAVKSGLAVAGMYCLFRPSFLNINFPLEFSFEENYLETHNKERDFIGMISEGYYINLADKNSLEKATKDFPIIFKPEVADDSNR
jgi:D-glycero-alpha-D-manno-heptose 1-phosphate guanylyltransferase